MMGMFLSLIFLAPFLYFWWLSSLWVLILVFLMMSKSFNFYFSSLSYGYGMDVVSYWMVMLTTWITFLMIISSFKVSSSVNKFEFLFVIIFLLLLLIMSFSCSNLFVFYLWFEASMIPTLILIFGWGYQPERLMAGFYLIFYTLFASLPMLISVFYIYNKVGSLFYFLISLEVNIFIYISMIMAFLIKMPMFFFHFWLPSAHVEAPVSGSMILAGVLLKLGGYGLLRVFLFLSIYLFFNWILIIISLFGSVVIGVLCLCQVDLKSMIAYSSVSHMGLVIGGIFTLNYFGMWGSLILMLGHGLCSSGMFALANIFYERSGSRSILINSGYINFMPSMMLLWFMLSINNMSSPPSLNLIGEIMLIMSLMSWSCSTMLFLGLCSFLSCCYSIYLYTIVCHGGCYSGLKFKSGVCVREYFLVILHLCPLNVMFLKIDIFMLWVL